MSYDGRSEYWDCVDKTKSNFKNQFLECIDNKPNPYHPLVWIHGEPRIGENVYIGGFSEINAKDSSIYIGPGCDIASFVSINCADSSDRTVGNSGDIERRAIYIGENVFIGSHCAILGGTHIGHHSVIGAGTILKGEEIPPYSLVVSQSRVRPIIKVGYYAPHNDVRVEWRRSKDGVE